MEKVMNSSIHYMILNGIVSYCTRILRAFN